VPKLTFDLAVVVRGVVGAVRQIDDCVASLSAEDFARPTRLGSWRVAELVAHLGVSNLARYVTGPTAARPQVDALGWVKATAAASADVNGRATAMADVRRTRPFR
jgi:hypothetical protein